MSSISLMTHAIYSLKRCSPLLMRGKKLALFALLSTLMFGFSPSKPAYAFCECSGVGECVVSSYAINKAVTLSVHELLFDFLRPMIIGNINSMVSVRTLQANQSSNTDNNLASTRAVRTDRAIAAETGLRMAHERAVSTLNYIPSRTTCRVNTRAGIGDETVLQRMAGTSADSLAQTLYADSQNAANGYLSGTDATTEQGEVHTVQALLDDRMKEFCDPTVLKPENGFPCEDNGEEMRLRYLDPDRAIFANDNIAAGSREERAARLFAQFAVNPVPSSALQGVALDRISGRLMQTRRLHNASAYNLAQGAIDHEIDQRVGVSPGSTNVLTDPDAAKKASVYYMQRALWNNPETLAADVTERSGQLQSANLDDAAPKTAETTRLYWQIAVNLQRLLALKSVQLARQTELNAAKRATPTGEGGG